jgi:peptide/nickel transport system permease protein
MSSNSVQLGGLAEVRMGFRILQPLVGRGAARRAGVAIVGLIVLLSVVVPLLSSHSPNDFVASPLQSPSWSHPFGTDTLGRDVFLRTFAAGRVDLFVAAAGVLSSLAFGTLIGLVVTSARTRVAEVVVMRVVDTIVAFPFIVLVLTLVLVFGETSQIGPLPPGLPSLLVAVFVWDWALYARLARVQTLVLRDSDFVVAARLLGYSRARIIARHLLPQVLRAAAAYAVADAIIVLVTTASLPFLGAGVQPPNPEWGSMMYEGRTVLETAWWVTILPGVVLALVGVGLSLISDGGVVRARRRR